MMENGLHDETMKMIMELGLHLGEGSIEKNSAKATETKAILKPVTKAASKPVKTVDKPILKPVSKEAIKPKATEAIVKDTKAIVKPVTKVILKSDTKNIAKPVVKTVEKPILKAVVKEAVKPKAPEAIMKDTKKVVKPIIKAAAKDPVKPLSKPYVVPSLQPQKVNVLKTKAADNNQASSSSHLTTVGSSSSNGEKSIKVDLAKDKLIVKPTSNWWLTSNLVLGKPLLQIPTDGSWYTPQEGIISVDSLSNAKKMVLEGGKLRSLLPFVEAAFDAEVTAYQKAKGSKMSGDQKWINDVLKSGTTSDKVAALALVVQESPLHELSALDTLIGLASKKEYRTSQLALEAVKDLMIHNLLPDRHLLAFKNQPLDHPDMNMESAMLFWYEEQVLLRVERIADALDVGLKSTIEFFKKQCMDIAADLLTGKPEKEARFLAMVVNKLGDPSGAVGSKCIELLRNIIRKHPAMKCIVVREVRQLIYRPNLAPRAVHSGIVFLSQVQLVKGDHDVAAQLVECYMSLFEKAVTQDELGSRLLSSLLSGLDRAFPFLENTEPISKHIDSLFRIIHSASFSTSTRALMLISHIALADKEGAAGGKVVSAVSEDETHLVSRFYRSLYAKLLSPQISTRAYNTLFLNLLFRSMKRDPSDLRVMAFLKRLGICALQSSPPIAAGLLFLLSEVYRARPNLLNMLTSEEHLVAHSFKKEGKSKDDNEEQEDGMLSHALGNFEASKREPAFAVSATPALWEASLLRNHFHPSVKSFSASMLEAPHLISFAGDPTTEFSLTAFLNRFAYKNPKKQHSEKIRRPQAVGEEPLNTSSFLKSSPTEMAPDKIFFHKFFAEKEKLRVEGKSRDRSKRKKHDQDDDASVDSGDDEVDFDEKAIDKYATKLAEGMMKDNDSEDVDLDDDFSDSGDNSGDEDGEDFDMGSDEDESGALDFEDFKKEKDNKKAKESKIKSKGKNRDVEEDSDDGYELTAGGGSDDDDEDDDDINSYDDMEDDGDDEDDLSLAFSDDAKAKPTKTAKNNKKGKGKKPSGDSSDFASAEDYEDTMDEIVGRYSDNKVDRSEKEVKSNNESGHKRKINDAKGNTKYKGKGVDNKSKKFRVK